MTDVKQARVVIVGGSAAGMSTATALRRRGHDGPITVLSAERHLPYDRPPLSKQYQTHGWELDRLLLLPADRLAALALDIRPGVAAESADLAAGVVRDDTGAHHPYDHLVIATGLVPRGLPTLAGLPALQLRTLEDAGRLRAALRPGTHVAVIGAGFIGLECAATARSLGAEVTVVEPVAEPLANRLGADTAARLRSLHADQGVRLRTGVTVDVGARLPDGRTRLTLADTSTVDADVVLVAVGAAPCVDWLHDTGIDVSDGVLCDEYSRVRERVWAVGDIARWHHRGYDELIRIEHRTNAIEQGQHVAAGIHGELRPYRPLPFFWTDHYDVRLQMAGRYTPAAVETHVDVPGRDDAFLKLFHAGGDLRAVLAWNAPKQLVPYRRELLARLDNDRVTA
ncbi:FAD/NAD(P)-binding oxidoreductase [Dactylosporangium sp. AC04546]|uniref:NAD(P)/FAD-dependent oxidoreductase n=1 Tax=Dactylosporangium sp. AC04546 TaxID=2862460 RepID=UPI001EE0B514|nr:FAD/NAD(P)-binding oxidoreductase [Dactylosporangium sp. AC04546]WVK80897.1 FAD/NAD(P)-binding oxidoreductase [Dactylosporangium sp. AC04546]